MCLVTPEKTSEVFGVPRRLVWLSAAIIVPLGVGAHPSCWGFGTDIPKSGEG